MLLDINPTAERIRRFEAKFMPEPMSGCWLWMAGSNEHGYGVFWNGERLEKAHRFSFRAYKGVLWRTDDCRHVCDNPACVNPDHLLSGSAKDNTGDMWRRHRATVIYRRGTAQAQAKLNDDDAIAIRLLYSHGEKQRDIASLFGVSQRLVWNVIHFRNWFSPSGITVERGRGR